MRIDPNRALDPNALPPSTKASARAAGGGQEAADVQAPGPDSGALSLDQVRQILQTTSQDKVARAKALIAAGELDTPEAIQRAAQALAKFGI